MADRGTDRGAIRNIGERTGEGARPDRPAPAPDAKPSDAGRTQGGGNLGHGQPPNDHGAGNQSPPGTPGLRDPLVPDPPPELEP